MDKYSKKDMFNLVKYNHAIDITNVSLKECEKIRDNTDFTQIGYNSNINGVSGAVLKDLKTGDVYVITKRNPNLLFFV